MEKFLMTTIATGILLISSACTTGASNNLTAYENNNKVETTGNFNKATNSTDPRCSTYPKKAEYKRRNQRLGLDENCN